MPPTASPPSSMLSNREMEGVEDEEMEMPRRSSHPPFDPQEEIAPGGRLSFSIAFLAPLLYYFFRLNALY